MYQQVLDFWFKDIDPSNWWIKSERFDAQIVKQFSDIHTKANRCELYRWRATAEGRLAEIIVLDQFSRNMFRDHALSFASDALALALAQDAILIRADRALNEIERSFLYMPFMHSESPEIHEVALKLYQDNGLKNNIEFEIKHKAIIDRFGRYPHRNKVLGRLSTEEELKFLEQPGSSF
ncbi:MAG: DUF924 family protein [Pontibacterium sp.]